MDFYIPFLSSIHEHHTSLNLAIVAHSHLDHYAGLENKPDARYSQGEFLSIHVQCSIEALDAILRFYPKNTKIILVGHSVGSWIILQVSYILPLPFSRLLFLQTLKERKDSIKAAFLLFPTLSNMADTPNGKLLSVSLSTAAIRSSTEP